MKRITLSLFSLVLLLAVLIIPVSANEEIYVFDKADLLEPSDERILSQKAQELTKASKCGIYFAAVEDYKTEFYEDDFQEAAAQFYSSQDLGRTVNRDGILLMYSKVQGQCQIYVQGWGVQFLKGLHQFPEDFPERADSDGLFSAVDAFLENCSKQLSSPGTNPYIRDDAGILTEAETAKLTAMAQAASEDVNCGIYIITVDDYLDLNNSEYTYIERALKNFYMREAYGTGPQRDGVILVLSMDARDYSLYTHGFGDSGLSDAAMDMIVRRFLDDFHDDDWYDGFEDYISYTQKYLKMTREGHPYADGSQPPEIHVLGFAACGLLGLLAARLVQGHFVKQMKSVSIQAQASGFISEEGLQLTAKEDTYTHTTTTRVYDPPSSSSSGGSRSSSSGSSSGCSRSGKF